MLKDEDKSLPIVGSPSHRLFTYLDTCAAFRCIVFAHVFAALYIRLLSMQ